MVKVEELLGAGALAYLAKKLIEGSTTTKIIPTTPGGFFGYGQTQEQYRKGLTTFLQDLSAGQGAYQGNGFEAGYKKDYDPKQIFSFWQPGDIVSITQPVDIQPYVGPSTFKFGTMIDNSGKLAL